MEAGRTDTMDPNKQRIAIAEYCGWTNYHIGSPGAGGAVDRPGRPVGTPPNRKYTCELPNYTGCLNAMHEAEKTIPKRDKGIYADILMRVVGPDGETDMVDDYGEWSTSPTTSLFAILNATAAQRAEAFLKTIGKWEE
jgi:hypothetical protein